MKKLFIIIATNLLLISCKNTDFENPEAVVRDFSQLVIDNKLDNAYELITDYSAKNYSVDDFKKYYGNVDSLDKLYKTEILKIEQIKYDAEKPDFRLFSITEREITLATNDTSISDLYYTVFKHNDKWKIIWVKPLFDKADDLERIGKYSEAKSQLEKVIEMDSYNGVALYKLAWLGYVTGTCEEGLAHAKKSIELMPNEWNVYKSITAVYGCLNELDLAVENSTKAATMCFDKKNKAICLGNVAISYTNLAKFDKSIFYINQAINEDSTSSFTWRVKGDIYSVQQKNDSATICLSKAIKLLKADEDNRLKEYLYFSYANAAFNFYNENNTKNVALLDSSYKYIVKAIDIDRDAESYRELLSKVKGEMK